MMARLILPAVAVVAFVAAVAGPAHAAACDAAKREMAFGEAAAEDARDAAGFKKAADQFFNATQKAPKCAAAFYNLGVVQEKAGELSSAKYAFEKYLKLAPKAADAAEVEKKILKLEYRIAEDAKAKQKADAQRQADERLARQLQGRWGHKELTFNQPSRIGQCTFWKVMRGMLTDFKVTGTKVEGIVVGTPFMNTSSCKSYYARQYVPFLKGTVKDGHLIGEKYDIRFAGADTGARHGRTKKFDWKIDMAPDGRSFTVSPKYAEYPKAGTDDALFIRW